MTPQQARLLVAILHRLAGEDKGAHEQIDDLALAVSAYRDLARHESIAAGSPEVGSPTLTVHED